MEAPKEKALVLDGLPYPWDLEDIKPSLSLTSRLVAGLTIEYQDQPREVVKSWEDQGLLATDRIVFIAHGFRNSSDDDWVSQMTEQMLAERDQTIACLDWSAGADLSFCQYGVAAANAKVVAGWMSRFLGELQNTWPDLYVWGVGHGLGAHILGMVGRRTGVFHRITGLDPAGPASVLADETIRLQSTDATIVDVIHTDGYNDCLREKPKHHMPVNHFGTLIPLGTQDFYPNYGTSGQPGASGLTGSHGRAIELFMLSIAHPKKFLTNLALDGVPGSSQAVNQLFVVEVYYEMGYYADENPANPNHRLFYLKTYGSEPWFPVSETPPPAER